MIDIFSQTGVVVVPVNLAWTMGAGMAKEAASRLPGLDVHYRVALRRQDLRLGRPALVPPAPDWPRHNRGVVLFATKDHWERPSQYEWISDGMQKLAELNESHLAIRHNHVWVPALGCGLGGLDEARVYSMFMEYLGGLPNMHYIGSDRNERRLGDQFRRGEST